MTSKPTIHLFHATEGLPFDVRDYRAIEYKLDETDDIEDAKTRLADQVRAVEKSEFVVSTPVTSALAYKNLVLSGDPKDKTIADLVDNVHRIELKLAQLEEATQVMSLEMRRGGYREPPSQSESGKHNTVASARLGQTTSAHSGVEQPASVGMSEDEYRDIWLERRAWK